MIFFHTENLPHYGLERIFKIAKEAGFDGIELAVTDICDTQTPAYIQELSNRYKIPVKAFSILEGQEENLTQAFQHTVREFPNTIINLTPPKTFSFQYKKWMQEIVPRLAEKYKLLPLYRNMPSKNVMGLIPSREGNSLMDLRELGGVCLDLSALAASGQEIMQGVATLGKQLQHVYLSNYYREAPYNTPDKGILPLENFFAKLIHNGYTGDFTLKVSPKNLGEGEEDRLKESLENSMKFFKKYYLDVQKKEKTEEKL